MFLRISLGGKPWNIIAGGNSHGGLVVPLGVNGREWACMKYGFIESAPKIDVMSIGPTCA